MANQTAAAIDENAIAPDTGKPMTKTETWRFMIGFIIFGIMWMMSGTIGSNVLFPERFNGLNIGQPEAILAAMNSVGSIFACSQISFSARFPTTATAALASARRLSFSAVLSAAVLSGALRSRPHFP